MLLALITGGGTGLGRAQAVALAAAGVNVIIAGRRSAPLEAVQAEIGDESCHIVPDTDIGKPECWETLAAKVEELGGELHVLSNNAGNDGRWGPTGFYDQVDPQYMIDYNTAYITSVQLSYHFMTKFLAKGAQSRNKPSIVMNVSSIASVANRAFAPMSNLYCVAKSAIDAITRTAYNMYRSDQILSIGINPGVYESDTASSAAAALGMGLACFAALANPSGVIGDPADVGTLVVAWYQGEAEMEPGMHYLMEPLAAESGQSILFAMGPTRALTDLDDPLATTRVWAAMEQPVYTSDGKQANDEVLESFRATLRARLEAAKQPAARAAETE